MVKASGQIEQELRLLQDKTEAMADALEPLYEGYLKALSEASKRQLVQAAYHLCTQAYPDKFLALSWDKRNQLQQALQAIATQIYDQLTQQRERAKTMSRRQQNNDGLAFLQRLLEARAASQSSSGAKDSSDGAFEELDDDLADFDDLQDRLSERQDSSSDGRRRDEYGDELFAEEYEASFGGDRFDDDDLDDDLENSLDTDLEDDDDDDDIDFEMEVPPADQRLSLDEEEDLLAALEGLARRSIEIKGASAKQNGDQDDDAEAEEGSLTPIHLVKQQMLLEKAIREVFKAVSEEVNELLQKAEVMPSFPKALMAAASDPRGMGDPVNAVPNVVKMSVRVMHGEAIMESDDENMRPRKRGSRRSNRSEPDRGNREFDRKPERRSERSSERRSGPRKPRRMPTKVIEIDALPEFAAISLRLSEVEFTDPTVSAWRGKLRQKLGELKKLGGRYKKTQRSLETAQAEDAWRSSWTLAEDDEQD